GDDLPGLNRKQRQSDVSDALNREPGRKGLDRSRDVEIAGPAGFGEDVSEIGRQQRHGRRPLGTSGGNSHETPPTRQAQFWTSFASATSSVPGATSDTMSK